MRLDDRDLSLCEEQADLRVPEPAVVLHVPRGSSRPELALVEWWRLDLWRQRVGTRSTPGVG